MLLLHAEAVALIEQHFLERTRSLTSGSNTRTDLLSEFRTWLCQIKTYKWCPACLLRKPEHKFPCDHALCEECSKELGHRSDIDPHLYQFHQCPICELPCKVELRFKPITAGFRVLTIDGGGIRAVIPIQFLRALEQAVGLEMPIQEHFDLSYGTSSGAYLVAVAASTTYAYALGSMVNLALYGLGLTVSETSDLFKKLASRVFRGRGRIGVGFAATLHSFIVSYRNGQFPANDIERALSDTFGNATMFDHPYMSSIGARTGFPIVNADTLETSLVTSYNGVARGSDISDCNRNSTYRVLRSENVLDDIPIKDA